MSDQLPKIPFLFCPRPNVLACGMPDEQGLREAAAYGINTVVNLCPANETPLTEPSTVTALGMDYLSIPVAGIQDLNRENAQKLADAMAHEDRKLMIHCRSSNRVGALMALTAYWLQGKTESEALTLGKAAGLTKLEEAVQYLIRLD